MNWKQILQPEWQKPYMKRLRKKIKEQENSGIVVLPPTNDRLSAFKYTPFNDVKVVILGQDPYQNVGLAHGLVFSVSKETLIPRSLQNIYKELNDDLGIPIPDPALPGGAISISI